MEKILALRDIGQHDVLIGVAVLFSEAVYCQAGIPCFEANSTFYKAIFAYFEKP